MRFANSVIQKKTNSVTDRRNRSPTARHQPANFHHHSHESYNSFPYYLFDLKAKNRFLDVTHEKGLLVCVQSYTSFGFMSVFDVLCLNVLNTMVCFIFLTLLNLCNISKRGIQNILLTRLGEAISIPKQS